MADTDIVWPVTTTDEDPDLTSRPPLAGSENAADLIVLTELIAPGTVTPVVDRTDPLEEAATNVRHMLDGKARGRTPPPGSTP